MAGGGGGGGSVGLSIAADLTGPAGGSGAATSLLSVGASLGADGGRDGGEAGGGGIALVSALGASGAICCAGAVATTGTGVMVAGAFGAGLVRAATTSSLRLRWVETIPGMETETQDAL